MENTRISIIVPCYNVEQKIKRCIDSIKEQSYRDFSVFLIDDGSKDHTADVIKKEIDHDDRFHYVYKENGGLSSARNCGMQFVESEFVCFVDSDDYLHFDYLKELVTPLIERDYDVSACYFDRVYEDHVSTSIFTSTDVMLCKFPAAWNKMFRTEIIRKNNLMFPEGLWYEDLCFFAQLVSHIESVYIVGKSLYYYVQNKNSIMYTYSDKIYDIYHVFEQIQKHGSMDKDRLEYINVYHILVGTVFRASFKEGFNCKELASIVDHVEQQYPEWFRNGYIKTQMPLFYKVYLFFIRIHWYGFVTMVLKVMNKHVSL